MLDGVVLARKIGAETPGPGGIWDQGKKEIIDFRLAASESAAGALPDRSLAPQAQVSK